MIRSTRHHIKDLNAEKMDKYQSFIQDYSDYVVDCVDYIWQNGYEDFSIERNSLSIPKYIDYNKLPIKSEMSARARSSAATQVSSIIRSSVEKQRRRLWAQKNVNSNIKSISFSKPKLDFVMPNLSSKCCDFKKSDGKFLGFVRLKSIGKEYGNIIIPIINHPRSGENLKSGFLFSKKNIQLSWEKKPIPVEKGHKIVGIDQGLNDVASLSDGQKTPKECPHGHSLNKILDKISRRKKGSKGFKKAIDHRKNFVNYSINQLNFSGVEEVRLEKITNIRYQKKSSRKMSHWSNPEIRNKIISRCEELEVPVVEQSSCYRSQRCSQCGQVRKSNRKGKHYKCKNCGYNCDADTNAALNHIVDLPSVPWVFLSRKLNIGDGFFWNPDGFFNHDGTELRVPCSQN
jgi:transposase